MILLVALMGPMSVCMDLMLAHLNITINLNMNVTNAILIHFVQMAVLIIAQMLIHLV